jgi:hypothetical protein
MLICTESWLLNTSADALSKAGLLFPVGQLILVEGLDDQVSKTRHETPLF